MSVRNTLKDSPSAEQNSTSTHIAEQLCPLHLQKRFLEERKKVYENLCVLHEEYKM